MDPFTAVKQAGNYVRLAEHATDGTDREGYLKAAKQWLQRADVDACFQHKPSPAVIIASDEKQDAPTDSTPQNAARPRPTHRRIVSRH